MARLSSLLILALLSMACTMAEPTGSCSFVGVLTSARADLAEALEAAKNGSTQAAASKGTEAGSFVAAMTSELDRNPSQVDPGLERALRLAIAAIAQSSFVFAGFVPDDPPAIADMVRDGPVALSLVDRSIDAAKEALDNRINKSLPCGGDGGSAT